MLDLLYRLLTFHFAVKYVSTVLIYTKIHDTKTALHLQFIPIDQNAYPFNLIVV